MALTTTQKDNILAQIGIQFVKAKLNNVLITDDQITQGTLYLLIDCAYNAGLEHGMIGDSE